MKGWLNNKGTQYCSINTFLRHVALRTFSLSLSVQGLYSSSSGFITNKAVQYFDAIDLNAEILHNSKLP